MCQDPRPARPPRSSPLGTLQTPDSAPGHLNDDWPSQERPPAHPSLLHSARPPNLKPPNRPQLYKHSPISWKPLREGLATQNPLFPLGSKQLERPIVGGPSLFRSSPRPKQLLTHKGQRPPGGHPRACTSPQPALARFILPSAPFKGRLTLERRPPTPLGLYNHQNTTWPGLCWLVVFASPPLHRQPPDTLIAALCTNFLAADTRSKDCPQPHLLDCIVQITSFSFCFSLLSRSQMHMHGPG
ncbi:hypothetical protein PTTG_29184 [Puccinia triticina 1-1 BBBD Race 1]|uniref:Uncharacterized protein n=1 Tax=Puccinia triticina (isolate 1-1 / race 1 (BBBD)) TaxID=630390 RepID=A0A180G6T2_PUCT1|nr:hypothetical protein PTTG_29184 [Puccinia triticina 1-1 BBBD Race 1]